MDYSGKSLRASGVPLILSFALFLLQQTKNLVAETDLDAVELFAGDRSVSVALRRPWPQSDLCSKIYVCTD